MNIEVRLLRSFCAVAEELHVTRAAERLHLSQQALSTHLRLLEERVGVRLVERTTRRVALTPAGEQFHGRVARVLRDLDAAVAEARRAASGMVGQLGVGLLGTSSLELTARILRAFSAAHPHVGISLRNVAFDDPSGGVRRGDTDVALVWLPFRTLGLHVEPLAEEPRVALLPAGHRLAGRERLRAAELSGEPFGWIEGLDEVALDFWTLASHRPAGTPRIGAHISGFEDFLTAIRLGQAVACTPAAIARTLPTDGIEQRPVVDAEPAVVAACRRDDDERPLVDAFLRVARATARDGTG